MSDAKAKIEVLSAQPGRERRRLSFDCPKKPGHRCEVLLKPWAINVPTWTWDGDEAKPTLVPSIRCAQCGWHGHITKGLCVQS